MGGAAVAVLTGLQQDSCIFEVGHNVSRWNQQQAQGYDSDPLYLYLPTTSRSLYWETRVLDQHQLKLTYYSYRISLDDQAVSYNFAVDTVPLFGIGMIEKEISTTVQLNNDFTSGTISGSEFSIWNPGYRSFTGTVTRLDNVPDYALIGDDDLKGLH